MVGTIDPVRVAVVVDRSPEETFRSFVEDMGSWWPRDSHSLGKKEVEAIVFEARAGGRVFERWVDGTEHEWMDVLVYEAPRRLVVTWKVTNASGSEVEVNFTPQDGATLVELEHRNWDRAKDPGARESYASGWVPVLDEFVRFVGAGV